MNLPHSIPVSELLTTHVTLGLECTDRMYLNGYVPSIQYESGVFRFLKEQCNYPVPTSKCMEPLTRGLVAAIERFAKELEIPIIPFERGQRKDDVAALQRRERPTNDGIVFIGKAQEKAKAFRTCKKVDEKGAAYPRLYRSTAMVNQYYFYGHDLEFGEFFLKMSSYFPFGIKLCINGHEWLKRQLLKEGIAFEALDNGILRCADPARMQEIASSLCEQDIERMFRRWLGMLPHPFTAAQRSAGYQYQLSILQAEFSRTLVFDTPMAGRLFFERAIHENLDMGAPGYAQLLFNRRVNRKTPGQFRTRVVTHNVIPSIHINYKKTDLKEYFKEGRALRVECTINDARDFDLSRSLTQFSRLREIGLSANRRLLDVQSLSHDPAAAQRTWSSITQPVRVNDQRGAALRFDDSRVQALFLALLSLVMFPSGFSSSQLRAAMAPLLGLDPATITRSRMTYDLRRLRLHGLIERLPRTHRYRLTPQGLRIVIFLSHIWKNTLIPGLALLAPVAPPGSRLAQRFAALERSLDDFFASKAA